MLVLCDSVYGFVLHVIIIYYMHSQADCAVCSNLLGWLAEAVVSIVHFLCQYSVLAVPGPGGGLNNKMLLR